MPLFLINTNQNNFFDSYLQQTATCFGFYTKAAIRLKSRKTHTIISDPVWQLDLTPYHSLFMCIIISCLTLRLQCFVYSVGLYISQTNIKFVTFSRIFKTSLRTYVVRQNFPYCLVSVAGYRQCTFRSWRCGFCSVVWTLPANVVMYDVYLI